MVGDVGPDIGMSSVAVVFCRRLRPPAFRDTLYRLTPVLREANYVGTVGYPPLTLGLAHGVWDVSMTLWGSASGKMFANLARGTLRRCRPSYDYGIAAMITLPKRTAAKLQPTADWFHPYDVSSDEVGINAGLVIACSTTVRKAQEELCARAKSLGIEDAQYRVDAGHRARGFADWVARSRE